MSLYRKWNWKVITVRKCYHWWWNIVKCYLGHQIYIVNIIPFLSVLYIHFETYVHHHCTLRFIPLKAMPIEGHTHWSSYPLRSITIKVHTHWGAYPLRSMPIEGHAHCGPYLWMVMHIECHAHWGPHPLKAMHIEVHAH